MSAEALAARIGPVRMAVLSLHRVLLETERVAWQRLNGRVTGGSELLQLAIHDPWFAWLRPLTALLAELDALFAERPEEAEAAVPSLLRATGELLHPDENGTDFQQRYAEFIQRSPDVAVAHGVVMRELARLGRDGTTDRA